MNDPKENLFSGLDVPLSRPWLSDEEAEAALEVIRSGWLIFGPRVAELERRFAEMVGVKHAIAVNSGSSALLVVQAAIGIGRDDEVIVPDMTFISTATSSMYLGARPVLADIDLDGYYNIRVSDIERRITHRTKAIVPVHYAGHTADMSAIMAIAAKHGLFVIEDAAEAHLSTYQGGPMAGSIGHAAIFSFTPSKPMTTGEGGMITTDDDEIADRCRRVRNFGDSDRFVWDALGFNFRMPEVMGAIGLVQLGKLPMAVQRRRQIAYVYNDAFADMPGVIMTPAARTLTDINYQMYTLRLNVPDRDDVVRRMLTRGVSTRLYYPCLHRQKVFADGGFSDADYPHAVEYARTAISLPIFPGMTQAQQSKVINTLKDVIRYV